MKFLQDLDREKNLSKAETRRVVKDVFEKTREQYENRILELKSHFTKELEVKIIFFSFSLIYINIFKFKLNYFYF